MDTSRKNTFFLRTHLTTINRLKLWKNCENIGELGHFQEIQDMKDYVHTQNLEKPLSTSKRDFACLNVLSLKHLLPRES